MTTTRDTNSSATETLESVVEGFVRSLKAKTRSAATIRAYQTDLYQFLAFIHGSNAIASTPSDVERADIYDHLAVLSQRGVGGASRARKLAAIREYFKFAESTGRIGQSPAAGVDTPRKPASARTYLRPDEYRKMLALAGARPRDFAILQTFLQTGVRVSELCGLRLDNVDLPNRLVRVVGKGMVTRDIELEQKGVSALRNWLSARPMVIDDHLFLNQAGEPIGERGVRKLVAKYRIAAGIGRKASCHSLRHTFATYKAERGVSPFQLHRWLGHASLATTQIYVHLGSQNAKRLMEATSL